MELNSYKQDKFFIVKASGRMDAISAPEFEKSCLEWIQQGESTLVVDLEGLAIHEQRRSEEYPGRRQEAQIGGRQPFF